MDNLQIIVMPPHKTFKKTDNSLCASSFMTTHIKRNKRSVSRRSLKCTSSENQLSQSAEKRFRKALSLCAFVISPFILAVIVSLIPVEDKTAFGENGSSGISSNNSVISNMWTAVQNGEDVNSALSRSGFITSNELNGEWVNEEQNHQLMQEFSDEIVDVNSIKDPVLNREMTILGFNRKGSSAEAFDEINNALATKGWQYVKVSDAPEYEGGAVFVKERGLYTWLMVTLMQVGDETSVCLRTQRT